MRSVLLSAVSSVVNLGATCPVTTLEDQFAASAAVFVGQATAQQVVVTARGDNATETTFEVRDVWKGTADQRVRVRTCGWALPNSGMTCSEDVRFVVGEIYLVFAVGQPLETSQCQPTERVDRAEKPLQWLSTKPHKKIGNEWNPTPKTEHDKDEKRRGWLISWVGHSGAGRFWRSRRGLGVEPA